MNCQSARETFSALLDPRGEAAASPEARAHLAHCPDCQREFSALNQTLAALDAMPPPTPPARLRQNFYAMLEEEKHSATSVRTATARQDRARRASLWRWIVSPLAAAALVAVGYLAGQRGQPAATEPAQNVTLNAKVQQLEDRLTKMSQFVGANLLQQNQRPANDRLRGVFASATLGHLNEKVINELISSLAFDPSANVRLGALARLSDHADNEVVRTAVVASLSREENPLVQISMIDFLAAAQDREAKPVLEKISASEQADANVRSAARRALTEL